VFVGEFTIISGESSGGKSSAAMQMTLANAREGVPCAWFSLEMTKEQIVRRYYAAMSTIITANHMRDPRLMNLHTHVPEMHRISEELSKLPIQIDDTSSMRIDTLRARIRMLRRRFGCRLFVVDYLQLIKGMPKMPRLEAFEHTVFTLRDIPKEEPDIHLAVLSQYSQGDKFIKGNKRTKDSLYGGSVIHHAAQNVIMITIEDPDKRDPLDLLDVEFRIAKQRDGKRGKVTCQFDRDHLTFCYAQRQL
jgi:replicative DNA helicase